MKFCKIISIIICCMFSINSHAQTASTFCQPYPLGEKLPSNPNFTGRVWLASLSSYKELNVPIANVTFEPACRNSWHSHNGGQILIATAGIGYYQEKGKTARKLFPGDIVEIAPNIVHWHGASPDSWFAHLAITCNPQNNTAIWLERVSDEQYQEATNNIESCYAEMNRVLTKREQAIINIALYIGEGDLEHLRGACCRALENGLTINEINEVMIHSYAYCGFPRSLRAIQTFMQVLKDRERKGIYDTVGREASYIENSKSKYERGRDILANISGEQTNAPKADYAIFAPTIERFLKEHLFADLFERDLLSYRERELATIAILAGIGCIEPMVANHMLICFNLGVTFEQLSALLNIVEINIGISSSETLRDVLEQVRNK